MFFYVLCLVITMYAKSKFFMFVFTMVCFYYGFMYLSGRQTCQKPPAGVNEFICINFGHVAASVMPIMVGFFCLYRLIDMTLKK